MPYIKGTCKAGRTKEYCFYYSSRYHSKKEGKRAKKGKPTSEAQKKVNARQAEKKLIRKINANFTPDDLYLTLSYKPEEKPKDREEMRKHMENFLRRIRRIYKKAEKVLKYIWVAEIGSRGAMHFHIILSGIEVSKIRKAWTFGHVNFQYMWDDGNYKRLAEYFVKYSEKTMGTEEELQGKRWNGSKNLITPPEKKTVIRSKDHYSMTIEVPAGFYLDKDSVQQGIHEITGYSYLNYRIVKFTDRQIEKDRAERRENWEVTEEGAVFKGEKKKGKSKK